MSIDTNSIFIPRLVLAALLAGFLIGLLAGLSRRGKLVGGNILIGFGNNINVNG